MPSFFSPHLAFVFFILLMTPFFKVPSSLFLSSSSHCRRPLPPSLSVRLVCGQQQQRMMCCQNTEATSNVEENDALKTLKEQMEKLKSDNELLTDKYKRALADMENLRKRTQRQVEEAKLFAIQPFCKDLLEVADVLDLALHSLDKAQSADGATSVDSGVHQGIKMTKEVLLKTFKKHGLVPVRPEGQKFDPNMHEALFEIPRDQSEQRAGHIAQVVKIGYSLHNRPIRPAKVGVVKME